MFHSYAELSYLIRLHLHSFEAFFAKVTAPNFQPPLWVTQTRKPTFVGYKKIQLLTLPAAAEIIVCTADVVPFTMKKALSAPKAAAASSCASFITETGRPRLSSGFMEFTSSSMQSLPKYPESSEFIRPPLCAGTSKCAKRFIRCAFSASARGKAFCSRSNSYNF